MLLCILASVFLHPVFAGRVLLPGDALLLMFPWRAHGPEKFPELYASGRFVPHNVLLDPIQQYYPWRKFATDSLRSGVIPLWNPYNFCGMPFVANGQSSVFYPLHVIFLLFGAEYGFGISAIVHLSLLGCATYGFLRQLALREISAFVGAVTFMFCGFNVVWLEYPTVSLWTMTWLPVALLCFECGLRNADCGVKRPGRGWSTLAGLALGVQFLAGHLQSGFYVLFCFSTYAVFRLLTERSLRTPHSALRNLIIPLAIAFCIGAIQLLPSLELIGFNPRAAGKRYEDVIASALPLRQLITLIAPNFFGNPVDGGIYWGHFNYIEMTGYVGVVALMLAVVAMCVRRTPTTWFFFGLAVFSLFIATGSPLYRLLFMLPGFKQVAAVARMFVLFDFAIAVLAAMGVERMCRNGAMSRLHTVGFALFVVLALSLALAVRSAPAWAASWLDGQPNMTALSAKDKGSLAFALSATTIAASPLAAGLLLASLVLLVWRSRMKSASSLLCAIIAVSVVADLWLFGFSFNPSCPRGLLSTSELNGEAAELKGRRIVTFVPGPPERFVEILPPNTNMLFGLRSAQGSDSLFPRWYAELFARSGAGILERNPKNLDFGSRVLSFLAVEHYWVPPENVGNFPLFPRLPRAYTTQLPTTDVPNASFDWKLITPASIETDSNSQVRLKATAQDGHLILADTYFPGWHAFAGIEQLHIERAYHALRAVSARAGTTTFVYLPTVFRVGAFVTLLTLGALSAMFIGARLSAGFAGRIPATVAERE